MKPLRQFCAALALILALSLSASAGDMDAGRTAPQPGEMPNGYIGQTFTTDKGTATETATGIALSLLQSVLSLF